MNELKDVVEIVDHIYTSGLAGSELGDRLFRAVED